MVAHYHEEAEGCTQIYWHTGSETRYVCSSRILAA